MEITPSNETLTAMLNEVRHALRRTGLGIQLRMLDSIRSSDQFRELVVLTLNGKCEVTAKPAEKFEDGPLASAHSTHGQILPFVDVYCNRIRNTMRPAMWGDHFRAPDRLFGRALGRVIAHELYHVLGRTHIHNAKGLASSSFTGHQLLAEQFEFEDQDVERIVTGGGI